MRIAPPKANLAVIVGRFQVDQLHPVHRELIRFATDNYDSVLIVLGCPAISNSIRNPLSYEARVRMIQNEFPNVMTDRIVDTRWNQDWSLNLDSIIGKTLRPTQTAVLIGGRDSFVQHYTGNIRAVEVESLNCEGALWSGSEIRARLAHKVEDSRDFRAGMIYQTHGDYPRTVPTVDIAVFTQDMKNVYLVRKNGEDKFRFPGGYVEAGQTLEDAAYREVQEEVGDFEIEPMKYAGSMVVDDWRYRSENSNILTTLFWTVRQWGPVRIRDKQEIAEVRQFNYETLEPDMLMTEHRPLLEMLRQNHKLSETIEAEHALRILGDQNDNLEVEDADS